jgi:hypothetical protein
MTDKEEIASLSQVFTVATQVRAPKGPGDPGAMVEGCYVVTDDVVTLTDRQGNPVRDQHGKAYTRKIANGVILPVRGYEDDAVRQISDGHQVLFHVEQGVMLSG